MNKEINSNRPSRIETWENIPKASWKGLKKTRSVTDVIDLAQTLPKHKSLNVLFKINRRVKEQVSNNSPITPVSDIMNIVADVDILRIAWAQIKNNKGALTPGSLEDGTADKFTNRSLYELSDSLRNGTFEWTPVRRIYVAKPGKPEKRTLGLPNFQDKVAQAALRLVLECVYEPIFEKHNHNFGFRPKKDPSQAVVQASRLAQGTTHAVEGDIKAAYPSVQHKILMDKISMVIQDKKVLKLVRAALEAGIMENGVKEDTLMGVPQGGIVSPLLFNIYMHSFDMFVENELKAIIEPEPNKVVISADYERSRSTIRRLRKRQTVVTRLEQLAPALLFDHCQKSKYLSLIRPGDGTLREKSQKILDLARDYDFDRDRGTMSNYRRSYRKYLLQSLTEEEQVNLLREYNQRLSQEIRDAINVRSQTSYIEQKPLKVGYVRYADDWVIFCSGNLDTANKIKSECARFLMEDLGLTLSPEKTRITHMRSSKVQFLGFELFFQTHPLRMKVARGGTTTTQRFRSFQIMPDERRLENRFLLKGYLDKKGKPREVGFLTPLPDHEIIRKYNQFIQGLVNYYIRVISYPSRVNRWIYILYYSCIKTLATKHRSSVKGIISKYGYRDISNPKLNWRKPVAYDLRVAAKYDYDGEERWEVLQNYHETMAKGLRLRHLPNASWIPTIDFLTLNKVNFRTKFKSETMCAVCNSPVYAMHHIKPLKHKGGRYTGYRGFDKVVASLGRKQIPVCVVCHRNIHSGKYDGLSLDDLYDIRLVAPESLLKFSATPSPPSSLPKMMKDAQKSRFGFDKARDFIIDKHKKTYYRESLNKYYLNKNNL